MLEPSLFRNGRFTAASVAVMVLFFGLGGITFVLTLSVPPESTDRTDRTERAAPHGPSGVPHQSVKACHSATNSADKPP